MNTSTAAIRPPRRPPGHDTLRGGLRFAAEVIAWVATPIALWPHSIPLAVLADVALIALPATFSTPGDRPGGDSPIAVPGVVTILLVLLTLAAATAASWMIWPWWAAAAVSLLCITVACTEKVRWRTLLHRA